MKNREFRELQVSSTQLAIIFFGILIIGVVIFLLGVSVGKKHAQAASKSAASLARKAPEQVKDRLIVPEAKTGAPQTAEALKPAPGERTIEPAAKAAETPPKVEAYPPAAKELSPSPDKAAAASSPPDAAAETVKSAPVVEAAAPAKNGYYYVQVGALAERTEAVTLAQKFKSQGYSVVVLDPLPNDRRTVYRVRIGGFATRPEADAALAKLASGSGRRVDYFIARD
jgi:cell division septation protein DedD